MSGIDDFFTKGDDITISAVDSRGDPQAVGGRYSTQVLQRASSMARRVVLGAAMGAVFAAAPALAHDGHAHASIEERAAAVKTLMGPTAHSVLRSIEVSERQLPGIENTSPMMMFTPLKNDALECKVSMYGAESAIAGMLKAYEGDLAVKPDPERLRQMFTIHEVAHCEVAGKISHAQMHSVGNPQASDREFFGSFGVDLDTFFSAGPGLSTLSFERQADSKMLLLIAKDTLGGATTDVERAEGLKRFNLYANDMLAIRNIEHGIHTKNMGADFFNDHDTRPAIEVVKKAVATAASSSDALLKFKSKFLGEDQMGDRATEIALGTIHVQGAELTRQLVSTTIASQVDVKKHFIGQLKTIVDEHNAPAPPKPKDAIVLPDEIVKSAREQRESNFKFSVESMNDVIGKIDADITKLQNFRDSGKAMQGWPQLKDMDPNMRQMVEDSVGLVKDIESNTPAAKAQMGSGFAFSSLVRQMLGDRPVKDRALKAASTLAPMP